MIIENDVWVGFHGHFISHTVKGERKRGRQKKRWEDNIKECAGMDFASSTRAAENRTRWKGIVAPKIFEGYGIE